MKKLLNKILWPLVVYALVVVILSIPVYIYMMNRIWINELDEHHQYTKYQVEKELNQYYHQQQELTKAILLWNQLQQGVKIIPATTSEIQPDQFYIVTRFDENQQEKEQFRGLAGYIILSGKPYKITIETNLEETEDTVVAVTAIALVFFVLLLGGFILLNRKISGKVWKPFYQTMDQLKHFELDKNTSITFEKSGIQEFEALNQTLNRLIENNMTVFRQQKEFTENASHELQTPLAIVRSKLDLLLQDPNLTREQGEMIESIHASLARTSRISKNLLLLAKIEGRQFELTDTIDINEVLGQDIELLSDYISQKQVVLTRNIPAGTTIHGNKSLVEILLTNLLLNAIRHSPDGGEVNIDWTGDQLVFSNTGTQSLERHQLFKRFIHSSPQNPGSGLGLAIVQQICHLHQWSVEYSFENNRHIFSVRF